MSHLENTKVKVILKPGRTKSIRNRHPWLFSGAIEKVEGEYQPGDIVSVYSAEGELMAKGFINPHSQIRVRLLTFQEELIDDDFFLNRLRRAYQSRNVLFSNETNTYRVVHADGDYLPGLIVDKYDRVIVVQIYSVGMEKLKESLIQWIREVLQPDTIVERSEASARVNEGLVREKKVLWGELENPVIVLENGIKYTVDVWEGQKTGLFLDQRDNRRRMATLAAGKKMLNCFSYTGGFSVAAAKKGAETISVEISELAQQMAKKNFELNGINPNQHRFVTANVFEYLRDTEEEFDIIILDPPAFVKKKTHMENGSRAYKDVNRLAIQKIKSGGLILTCSCSSFVHWVLFQQIVYSAAKEAGRSVQILSRFGHPVDHPINIFHPEGEYLKSMLLRVY